MSSVAKEPSNIVTQDPYYIPVPRRMMWRRTWRVMMRAFALFYINADVHGRRKFPRKGPAIIVANHNAFLEVAMIQAFAPYPIEFLTTGDIPLEPRFAMWANLYGFIPVKRGSMDRTAMSRTLSVLEQGGVVGMFPQGGIWDTKVTQARTGVAWLSQKSGAPVVPIGFGGTAGAFAEAVKLKRPRITMNVGDPIPPAPTKIEGLSRKDTLEHYTGQVMQSVFDLIPQWEKDQWHSVVEESFDLMLAYNGEARDDSPTVRYSERVALFFHRPVLLDAMRRNLELPVAALEHLPTERNPQAFADALQAVIHYVTEGNEFFLTYRFGNDEGKEMTDGLRDLREAALWAAKNNLDMNIMPIRRFRMDGDDELTVQHYPNKVKDL